MNISRITATALIVILVGSFIPSVYAETWQLEKEADGITIYTRAVQGADIREFKGELIIDTSLASLLAVFQDIENFPTWNHQCSHATLLKQVNLHERYHYQNLQLPFPVKNRDLVIHSKVQQSKDKILIHSRIATDFCATATTPQCKKINQSKNINIHYAKGTHQFIPQTSGGVKVIWQQHIDPAGKIPPFLVNKLLVDIPYVTLNKLRTFVKKTKYQQAKMEDFTRK